MRTKWALLRQLPQSPVPFIRLNHAQTGYCLLHSTVDAANEASPPAFSILGPVKQCSGSGSSSSSSSGSTSCGASSHTHLDGSSSSSGRSSNFTSSSSSSSSSSFTSPPTSLNSNTSSWSRRCFATSSKSTHSNNSSSSLTVRSCKNILTPTSICSLSASLFHPAKRAHGWDNNPGHCAQRSNFQHLQVSQLSTSHSMAARCDSAVEQAEVVIALGSNLGDRGANLLQGLRQLKQQGVQVLRTSCLYETAPAYVTDQPSFLNAAILARTDRQPRQLLSLLKQIEEDTGRDIQGGPRWGPRPLDLDIIFYGAGEYTDDALQIPHARWHERDFVKAPVADLLYDRDVQHGRLAVELEQQSDMVPQSRYSSSYDRHGHSSDQQSVYDQLLMAVQVWRTGGVWWQAPVQPATANSNSSSKSPQAQQQPSSSSSNSTAHSAMRSSQSSATHTATQPSHQQPAVANSLSNQQGGDIMRRVTPLLNGSLLTWGNQTYVMGILNVTPDSFSDGGRHVGVEAAVTAARQMVAEGVHILDIGGQSTRPGAARLSAEEELSRVIPVIRALKQHPETRDTLISIDTFYAHVAREAVAAGADIVNDVSGGTLDGGMLSQVAELGAPYILMHMRGDPTNMQSKEQTQYSCVWRDVGRELQAAAEKAVAAGIPAWNVILDPGLGFAKTGLHNVELIQNLGRLRHGVLQGPWRHAPLLLGPSRKGFLGKLTGRSAPADRDAGTVAAVTACVAEGADIVRVHNVRDTLDGVKVADAVYRGAVGPLMGH